MIVSLEQEKAIFQLKMKLVTFAINKVYGVLDADVSKWITSPTITNLIEPRLKGWSRADEAALERDLRKVQGLMRELLNLVADTNLDTVYLQGATELQDNLKENMELLGKIFTATGVGAGYGQTLDKGAEVFKVTKYIANLPAISKPLEAIFGSRVPPDPDHRGCDKEHRSFGRGGPRGDSQIRGPGHLHLRHSFSRKDGRDPGFWGRSNCYMDCCL